jgi:hypothetical protein
MSLAICSTGHVVFADAGGGDEHDDIVLVDVIDGVGVGFVKEKGTRMTVNLCNVPPWCKANNSDARPSNGANDDGDDDDDDELVWLATRGQTTA